VKSSCEHGNETSGYIKCWEVLVAFRKGLSSVSRRNGSGSGSVQAKWDL
jgi:hypothetical protein